MRPNTTSNLICLDTSYLVGFFDEDDLWHNRAMEIYALLDQSNLSLCHLDCVLNELFTVLARRCRERRRPQMFDVLVEQIHRVIPSSAITWAYPHLPGWYDRCLAIMRETEGLLNFHDCLIVVAGQEFGFSALISFDSGFDMTSTVNRLGSAREVEDWISSLDHELQSPSDG